MQIDPIYLKGFMIALTIVGFAMFMLSSGKRKNDSTYLSLYGIFLYLMVLMNAIVLFSAFEGFSAVIAITSAISWSILGIVNIAQLTKLVKQQANPSMH